MMKRILLGIFLAALASAGLASEKLGIGDAVRVTVYQQPDLTTDARVTERGTIKMPLVGEVKVAGMSLAEAGKQIGEELQKGQYLKNPQVSVALTTLRSRQVSVLGMVARPGRYALDDTSSQLADVIAAAGGISAGAEDTVIVLREGKEHKVNVLAKPFQLQGGDTVNVERAPVFYIYGEVTRSGAYRLEPNMTVMQAIAAGGGITPRGSDRRVKLRRTDEKGKLWEKDVKLTDRVKTNDVIIIKESLF
jgi:polysaccharide export outer membrane protein